MEAEMKKTVGKVVAIMGIVLIIGSAIWWAFAVNSLVKIQSNVDSIIYSEGEYTTYVNVKRVTSPSSRWSWGH
jgi:hypothetical protein